MGVVWGEWGELRQASTTLEVTAVREILRHNASLPHVAVFVYRVLGGARVSPRGRGLYGGAKN